VASRPLFLDRQAGGLALSLVRSEADFARLHDEWPPSGVPFRSHEWLHTWWRHFGRTPARRELAMLLARDRTGRLRGALPMYREHGPILRWASLLGAGVSRHLGIVAAPTDETEIAGAFADALRGALRARFIDGATFDGVDRTDPLWRGLPGMRPARFESGAARRYHKPRLRGIELESLLAPQAIAAAFGEFVRLAQPPWTPELEAFHRDAALLCPTAELHFLTSRGRRRAALLGLRAPDRLLVCAHGGSRILLRLLPHAEIAGGDACLRIVPAQGALRFVHAASVLYRLVKGAA
jgi:hypothetical protein